VRLAEDEPPALRHGQHATTGCVAQACGGYLQKALDVGAPSEELLYPLEKVEAALEEIISKYRVDRSRIYVVGYSRGGFGAWAMAEQFPQMFAAVVPIAGGGNRHYLSRTNEKTAFWVFHGTDDDVILLSDSVIMYERLNALKRNARLSVLEGVDHSDIEGAALNDPELWEWLLKQRLEAAAK
jgi:predicted peptidase